MNINSRSVHQKKRAIKHICVIKTVCPTIMNWWTTKMNRHQMSKSRRKRRRLNGPIFLYTRWQTPKVRRRATRSIPSGTRQKSMSTRRAPPRRSRKTTTKSNQRAASATGSQSHRSDVKASRMFSRKARCSASLVGRWNDAIPSRRLKRHRRQWRKISSCFPVATMVSPTARSRICFCRRNISKHRQRVNEIHYINSNFKALE